MTTCPNCKVALTKKEVSGLLLVFSEMKCSSCEEIITINPLYKELLALDMASTTIHTIFQETLPLSIKEK